MTATTATTPPRTLPHLGLNKLVKATIAGQIEAPRDFAFHPSELADLCPVLHFFHGQALDDLASTDPDIIQRAASLLRDIQESKARTFSPGVRMEFRLGDYIHEFVQYWLGMVGRLWGQWRCGHCHRVVGPGWMPRMTVRGLGGDAMSPAVCTACRCNVGSKHLAWLYVEPTVRNAEWYVDGRCDGDLRAVVGEQAKRYVLEVKSINSAGYDGKRGVLPYERHVIQASVYAWLLGVEEIYFVYVNKDQINEWREIVHPVDWDAIERVKVKIRAVREAVATGQPPLQARACPHVNDERARSCPAVVACFGRRPEPNFWDRPPKAG